MSIFLTIFNTILKEETNIVDVYKDIWIEISNKTEIDHFLKRLNDIERNCYSIDIILKIIKRGLDKFLFNSKFKQYREDKNICYKFNNFSIEAKEFNLIKIKLKDH